MTQNYSDPKRADDPHALPDIEVFYLSVADTICDWRNEDGSTMAAGWYWWSCFPGVPAGR